MQRYEKNIIYTDWYVFFLMNANGFLQDLCDWKIGDFSVEANRLLECLSVCIWFKFKHKFYALFCLVFIPPFRSFYHFYYNIQSLVIPIKIIG